MQNKFLAIGKYLQITLVLREVSTYLGMWWRLSGTSKRCGPWFSTWHCYLVLLFLFISSRRRCPFRKRSSAADSTWEHRSRNPSGRRRTSVRSNCFLALLSGLGGRCTPTGLHYPPLLHIAAVVGQKWPNPTYQHLSGTWARLAIKRKFLGGKRGVKNVKGAHRDEGTRVWNLKGSFELLKVIRGVVQWGTSSVWKRNRAILIVGFLPL